MEQYKLEVVESKKQKKEFHDLARRLYAGNRYWVCPIDNDIENIFDPAKNEQFVDGEAIRWILRDPSGKVVGRIAAFYNREIAARDEQQPTGGCGFLEAVNDQKVANILFDAAKLWLEERGMEAMDGPINFGSRDSWWGLLVEGFELQPLYQNPYNHPYYKELFENYGFRNYFNQHTYSRNFTAGDLNQSVYDRVKRLRETPGYRFEHISKSNLEQVADDFCMIYNKAWAMFPGVKPMDRKQAQAMMKELRPIIDEKLIYFAFFNDEPVGFFIMVPDLNRVLGRFKGKLNMINKLRLLWLVKSYKADRVFGIIFGVTPEFHGKGIESGIIYEFERAYATEKIKYKNLELAWIGDFNPVMMRMVENYVCAQRHKMHTTYRYLFDRNKEFARCPKLGLKRDR